MESLKRSLSLEMDQLAAGIFIEQEPVLAAMLSQPPNSIEKSSDLRSGLNEELR